MSVVGCLIAQGHNLEDFGHVYCQFVHLLCVVKIIAATRPVGEKGGGKGSGMRGLSPMLWPLH